MKLINPFEANVPIMQKQFEFAGQTQSAFTWPKSIKETPGQCVKSVQN